MLSNEFIVEAGEMPIYYFAYGMLTDPKIMIKEMQARFIGPATLNNFNFELLAFANVIPKAGSKVEGCLWEITRKILSVLDDVEGYPQLYDRKTVPVVCKGKRYEAELYTMTTSTREQLEGTYPKRSYIKKLIRGYTKAGLSLDQIDLK